MALPNLGPHVDGAVDMPPPPVEWREIISNVRDYLIERNQNLARDVDCTAGGTIVLTDDQRYAAHLIRLIGSPGAGFTIEMADGNKQMDFENASGQIATIESTSGAASPPTIPDGETRIIHLRGMDFTVAGKIGLQAGALLSSGQVPVAGSIDFLDFNVSRVEFSDLAFEVTSPTVSAGTLTLDLVNGNYFDVTLTADVTTLVISNALVRNSHILLEDGSGVLLLESGDKLLREENDASSTLVLIARQDGSGDQVITWPSSILWEQASTTSPAQTLTASAVDIYLFTTVDAGTTWFGMVLGLDMG